MNRPAFAYLVVLIGVFVTANVAAQDAWHKETVRADGLAGIWGGAIAVDTSRNVHIVASDQTAPRELRHHVRNANGFLPPAIIDSSGEAWGPAGVAIDDNNILHVCYARKGASDRLRLWYAKQAGNTWVSERIEDTDSSNYGEYCAIAVQGDGQAHIAYHDQQTGFLKYVRQIDGAWQAPVQVDFGRESVRDIAIALNRSNKAYIVYYHYREDDFRPASIKMATNSSGGDRFLSEEISNAGTLGGNTSTAAITIDDKNILHVAYYYAIRNEYRYARRTSQGWTHETFADAAGTGAGGDTTVLVNFSNRVSIVFGDRDHEELRQALRSPDGDWTISTIDAGEGGRKIGAIATAYMDAMDRTHIAYGDFLSEGGTADFDLKYASNNLRGADISMRPRFWSFGEVEPGTTAEPVEIEFFNSGAESLSVEPAMGMHPGEFSVYPGGQNPCAGLAFTLISGDFCTLFATVSPSHADYQQAYIPFSTNDPDTGTIGVTLLANPLWLESNIADLVRELPEILYPRIETALDERFADLRVFVGACAIAAVLALGMFVGFSNRKRR